MEYPRQIRVLVIDDEREAFSNGLVSKLKFYKFYAEDAITGEEGLEKIKTSADAGTPFNVVICDLMMPPGIDGDEVLEKALKLDSNLCFIMLTGFGDVESAVAAMKKGAYYYFGKPLGSEDGLTGDEAFERLFQTVKRGVIEKELRKIRKKVLSSLDLNYIFDSIMEAVEIIFNPGEYCLVIIEKDEKELLIKKHKGLKNLNTSLDRGFIKKVINDKQSLLIKDIEKEKVDDKKILPLKDGSKSLIAVPLSIFNDLYGLLEVEGSEINNFSEFDLNILSDFGNEAAIAIFNSKQYKKIEKQSEKIEKQKNELIELYEDYIKSFNSISHQMKHPLYVIQLAVSSLLDGLETKSYSTIKEKLETIYKHSDLAVDMVKKTLLNYKDEKVSIKLSGIFIRLKTLFAENKNISWPEEKKLEIELNCKPNQIEFVIQNLISNALKAVSDKNDGEVKIDLPLDKNSNHLDITIEDNGKGIEEKNKGLIFKEIFTTKGESEQIGSGLGLFLSKSFIKGHGGEIDFESQENVGTKFMITLPLGVQTGSNQFRNFFKKRY